MSAVPVKLIRLVTPAPHYRALKRDGLRDNPALNEPP